MRLKKPKFWGKKNSFLSIVLIPLTLLVRLYIFLKKKFSKEISFKIPIICIGNLYIGGTGKTPLTVFIANKLSENGKKTVIVRKYYSNQNDECDYIRENFQNLIVEKKRYFGVKKAYDQNYEYVLLDDGFQDLSVKKKLNIICFNQKQLVGNGMIIPSGPLREGLECLKEVQIVVINGKIDKDFETKILSINNKIEFFYSHYKPKNIDEFKDARLLAFAGIGNPSNFFDLLEENGLDVKRKIAFPDHYNFSKTEILEIINEANKSGYQILTTEKDFLRIKKFNFKEIKFIKNELVINQFQKLINKILTLHD